MESVDCLPLDSPVSATPMYKPNNDSELSSPVSIVPEYMRKDSSGHVQSCVGSGLDEIGLNRYGQPAYGQLAKYLSQPRPSPTTPVTQNIIISPSYRRASVGALQCSPIQVLTPTSLTPQCGQGSQVSSAQPSPMGLVNYTEELPPSTTLLSYLTAPTQAINLVRNVSVIPTRGLHDYFWWDIRNLRSWSTFSLPTFNSINNLTKLLKTEISSHLVPETSVPTSRLSPEAEPVLVNLLHDVYAPRVNAALAVSQGPEHLRLYLSPNMRMPGTKHSGSPHFLANYANDAERNSTGLPRGRLVGVVKNFDRWNSGMRHEAANRQVEYLNGLAHLQRCMREHSCRYGFIMTEIELVCVRAACDVDDVPYFGFLEVSSSIPTKSSAAAFTHGTCLHSPATSDFSSRSRSPDNPTDALNVPMTASLALYFLLMLSKAVPLPSQPSARLNVGGPSALTRQHVLPEGKDRWIPAPQVGEKRDAKRVRGWVWPADPWHRREGGRAPRSRGSTVAQGKGKRWHK